MRENVEKKKKKFQIIWLWIYFIKNKVENKTLITILKIIFNFDQYFNIY